MSDYLKLIDDLQQCEKGTDEEFYLYQKLVNLCESEEELEELHGLLSTDVIDHSKGTLPNCSEGEGDILLDTPAFLDEYAAPMDNLADLFMKRNDYANALALLEKVLPIYRTLEIRNPEYTWQRLYAMEKMVDCLHKLGNVKLALVYEYELKYLRRDVLDMRKNNS
jgi:hypothetical protein